MSQIANQTPTLFHRFSDVIFEDSGAVERTVCNIIAGSFNDSPGGRTPVPIMDKGEPTGTILAGNARAGRVTFNVQNSPDARADIENIILQEDETTGRLLGFVMHIDQYDTKDRTGPGTRYTYPLCYVDTPPSLAGSGGTSPDALAIQIVTQNPRPTVTAIAGT